MVWKKIEGFENYSISVEGDVRNDTTMKLLKSHLNNKGYPMVNLWKNNKGYWRTIHRLIAIAFLTNPEGKPCINHIDGNKLNHSVDNLEWCSHSENQFHRHHILKKSNVPKEAWEATRKAVVCVETGKVYASVNEAARRCGLWQQSITRVLNGKMHTTGGFHWRYVDET